MFGDLVMRQAFEVLHANDHRFLRWKLVDRAPDPQIASRVSSSGGSVTKAASSAATLASELVGSVRTASGSLRRGSFSGK